MPKNDEFDKPFRRAERAVVVFGLIGVLISIAPVAFIGWALIQVMRHYGII